MSRNSTATIKNLLPLLLLLHFASCESPEDSEQDNFIDDFKYDLVVSLDSVRDITSSSASIAVSLEHQEDSHVGSVDLQSITIEVLNEDLSEEETDIEFTYIDLSESRCLTSNRGNMEDPFFLPKYCITKGETCCLCLVVDDLEPNTNYHVEFTTLYHFQLPWGGQPSGISVKVNPGLYFRTLSN